MGEVKIYKVISESKKGFKKEVIINDDNYLSTKHIHKKDGNWYYLKGKNKMGKPIFGIIALGKR